MQYISLTLQMIVMIVECAETDKCLLFELSLWLVIKVILFNKQSMVTIVLSIELYDFLLFYTTTKFHFTNAHQRYVEAHCAFFLAEDAGTERTLCSGICKQQFQFIPAHISTIRKS